MFHPKGPTFMELARQALSSTTRGYDLLAPKFDYTPFRTPVEVLEAAVARVEEPVGSILDLACGTGAAMEVFREKARDEIWGVDLSEGMLAEARKNLVDAPGDAEVHLVQGDVLALEFEDYFDVVTCFGALGHILRRDQTRFAEGIARALKPGGSFLFVTAPMPPAFSRRWLVSRAFNGAMHLRNALIRPPFIMFYLLFCLEEAREVLEPLGFELEVSPLGELGELHHDAGLLSDLVVVKARLGN